MRRKYQIGDLVGKNLNLLIKGYINDGGRSKYVVECQVCKLDPELNGDTIYTTPSENISSGKLPCFCSYVPKRTKYQTTVLCKRKAIENNHNFIGFVDDPEKVGQNVKLLLKCNDCRHEWKSCSVANYLRNRKCPSCANTNRSLNKRTPTSDWIDRFRKSGMFPEETYSFERVSDNSRKFYVICKKCGEDKQFISDRSNLVAGKVPCACNIKCFDHNKKSYFYLHHVSLNGSEFFKFGITNFPHRRKIGLIKAVRDLGGDILDSMLFTGDGKVIQKLENEIKSNIAEKYIDEWSFKTETFSTSSLHNVILMIEQHCLIAVL